MRKQLKDVQEFHRKFEHNMNFFPANPPKGERIVRVALISEECQEALAVISSKEGNLSEIAHELGDMLYVTLGAFVSYGIDPGPVFDAIHRANMAKEAAGTGKPNKPESWEKPDIKGIIERQSRRKWWVRIRPVWGFWTLSFGSKGWGFHIGPLEVIRRRKCT